MTIGELAKHSGLTTSCIRLYESAGLLRSAERRPNDYRAFLPEALLTLELIITAQKVGFTLDEIRLLLPTELVRWDHGPLVATLRRRIEDIQAAEAQLARSRALLETLVRDIESKPEGIDCAANAQRVLSRLRLEGSRVPGRTTDDVRLSGRAADRRRATATG